MSVNKDEIKTEALVLKALGLTDEEIEGYFEFFYGKEYERPAGKSTRVLNCGSRKKGEMRTGC
jgi:hypothetical protein